jgi:toxin FitB
MTVFLLDTNVLSEIVRPKPSANMKAFLEREGDLWLSVVTLHEFAYGVVLAADAARRLKFQTWIESIKNKFSDRILNVTPAIAETAGRLRGSRNRKASRRAHRRDRRSPSLHSSYTQYQRL